MYDGYDDGENNLDIYIYRNGSSQHQRLTAHDPLVTPNNSGKPRDFATASRIVIEGLSLRLFSGG